MVILKPDFGSVSKGNPERGRRVLYVPDKHITLKEIKNLFITNLK